MYETSQCCECVSEKISGEKLISRKQLLILYDSDERRQIRDHKKYSCGKLTQICMCKYSAKLNVDIKDLDIVLANRLIKKCGKHELGIDNWIAQIMEVRNEIFHLSDMQQITETKYQRYCKRLEGSIMGVAMSIDSVYAEETWNQILQTKQLTIVSNYMLKSEIIHRDYWVNKCAELEVCVILFEH